MISTFLSRSRFTLPALLAVVGFASGQVALAQESSTKLKLKFASEDVNAEQEISIEMDGEMKKLAQENLRLKLQMGLDLQKLRNELAELKTNKERMELELAALEAEQKLEVARINKDKEKLQAEAELKLEETRSRTAELEARKTELAAEIALDQEKLQADLLAVRAETEKLQAEQERALAEVESVKGEYDKAIAELTKEKEKLEAEVELAKAKNASENLTPLEIQQAKLREEIDALEKEIELTRAEAKAQAFEDLLADSSEYRLYLAETELYTARAAARASESEAHVSEGEIATQLVENETRLMDEEMDRLSKRDDWNEFDYDEVIYTTEPFKGGVLTISDRRIQMNSVITSDTAKHVTEMIDYYNNKSTKYPIFIVIDTNPGGSVMAGYRIVKSIQGSEAPVHVVVKSYAASMAAAITALAPESYAYPNAIIHHHQMSSFNYGNLTQQKEQLAEAQEWWNRLAGPIAEKMGITLEEFVDKMYEVNSEGEWKEFADVAVELNWVNNIVTEVQEEGLKKKPEEERPSYPWFLLQEKIDDKGLPYVELPRLQPYDAWYLHNPDGYYRLPGTLN